ncbi:MAG: DUF4375 domain-containing protein [Rhodocyclaceae bacterium]|nr:MAG: DUF4375 domain-containing protein [Rhodocyclaceae bacterium]
MKPLATVSASELRADPSARFWALIMYLAEHSAAQKVPDFREFWLAYLYDAEVNNGGHLQYFHNQGTSNVSATVQALGRIGAEPHALLLSECWRQVQHEPLSRVASLEEYSTLASERSFVAEDKAYYALPSVTELLEGHYGSLIEHAIAIGA